MTATPHRAHAPSPRIEGAQYETEHDEGAPPPFDEMEWSEAQSEHEQAGAGGRAVLGWALALLAILWTAYTAWSAGRALATQPLTSPAIAQWVAIAAGPLALLGLVWLMFGRTRRKEAEAFTRSVIAMRTEARSLEALLEVLSQRIGENHTALGTMTNQLMGLGDEAATRLGSVTRELDEGSRRLVAHGEALDRAAAAARVDIGVLLEDLPRAESSARTMSEALRGAGAAATEKAALFEAQVQSLSERTREADTIVSEASQRLVANLSEIQNAGATAGAKVAEAASGSTSTIDSLLQRSAEALEEIRSGIDIQAATVAALVEQASAGIGRAGLEAAEQLGSRVASASSSLDGLSARVAEQERASQRMLADIGMGLASLDEKFATLASEGDSRASSLSAALSRIRNQLEALAAQTVNNDGALDDLAARTSSLRGLVDELTVEIGSAEEGTSRLLTAAQAARPEIEWAREAAQDASTRLESGASAVEAQHDRLAALLAAVDTGVGGAERRLAELSEAIGKADTEASRLSAETGPALVAALVQVKEAAGHAAERAREAISAVIPDSAGQLSDAARNALEKAVRDSVTEQLRLVEDAASRAVEAAKNASERLTQQMISIGQSAAALEAHLDQTGEDQRQHDSENFAKRVSLLIDSMHSASIDVGKILSDEVDDKAWGAYLKGNRGIFTRRAVRLLGGSESRALANHYEADREFHDSVNRYVHDFEAMLRRVLAERDGGPLAVTLMSSDVGKLYAALAPVVERSR